MDGPITIAGDETNANHIADFGIGMPDANFLVDWDLATGFGLPAFGRWPIMKNFDRPGGITPHEPFNPKPLTEPAA